LILRYTIILFLILSQHLFAQDTPIDLSKFNIENKPTLSLQKIDKVFIQNKSIKALDSARLYELKGDILKNIQNVYSAIDNYKKSLVILKNLNKYEPQIIILNKISELHITLEEFSKAIDNQNKVTNLLSAIDNKEVLSSKHTANLALTYFKTGTLNKAKIFYKKAISLAENNNELALINYHYKDLAQVFISTNQLDSASFYNKKSLKYSVKYKKHILSSSLYTQKGEIFEKQHEYIRAENGFNKAIKTLAVIGVNNTDAYIKLADFYERIGLHSFAHNNYRKAITKTIKSGNKDAILSLYLKLVNNSLEHNKPKRSLYYLKKYNELSELNKKEEKKRNINYINERYNIQQEEIIYLNNKHTLQEKEVELSTQKQITQKNKLLYTILLILFGLLFFLGILYSRFYKLKTEKLNMRLKNTVLRLQMNPHFIFNSLTVIQNSILKNDRLKSAELIATFSKLIRQNLDFSNKNYISLTDELDMLANYLDTQQFRFDNLFSYEINVDPIINTDDIQIPPMLMQPFVENSIEHGLKHKEKDGKIKISLIKKKDGINISIVDNGVGLQSSKKYNLSDDADKIHAINIFKERLKLRKKDELQSFELSEITTNNKVTGTRVSFTLKI